MTNRDSQLCEQLLSPSLCSQHCSLSGKLYLLTPSDPYTILVLTWLPTKDCKFLGFFSFCLASWIQAKIRFFFWDCWVPYHFLAQYVCVSTCVSTFSIANNTRSQTGEVWRKRFILAYGYEGVESGDGFLTGRERSGGGNHRGETGWDHGYMCVCLVFLPLLIKSLGFSCEGSAQVTLFSPTQCPNTSPLNTTDQIKFLPHNED